MNKFVLIPHEQYESFKKFSEEKNKSYISENKSKDKDSKMISRERETTDINSVLMSPDKSSIKTDIRAQLKYPKNVLKVKEEQEKINHPPPGIPNNIKKRQLNANGIINEVNKNEQIGRGGKEDLQSRVEVKTQMVQRMD